MTKYVTGEHAKRRQKALGVTQRMQYVSIFKVTETETQEVLSGSLSRLQYNGYSAFHNSSACVSSCLMRQHKKVKDKRCM